MMTFAFYIEDDRYTVPTLKLEALAGEAEARRRADVLWEQSPQHRGVEVCLDGLRLFGVGSCADTGVGACAAHRPQGVPPTLPKAAIECCRGRD